MRTHVGTKVIDAQVSCLQYVERFGGRPIEDVCEQLNMDIWNERPEGESPIMGYLARLGDRHIIVVNMHVCTSSPLREFLILSEDISFEPPRLTTITILLTGGPEAGTPRARRDTERDRALLGCRGDRTRWENERKDQTRRSYHFSIWLYSIVFSLGPDPYFTDTPIPAGFTTKRFPFGSVRVTDVRSLSTRSPPVKK